MAPDTNYNPFDPENYSSGGFLDNVDATVIASKVDTWEEAEGQCYWHITFQPDDADADPHTQYYRIGTLDQFTPSNDKTEAIPIGEARMNKKVGAAQFTAAVITSGFPRNQLSKNVTYIVGLRFHLQAFAQEEIKQDSAKFKGKKKDGGRTIVLPTKLLEPLAKSANVLRGPVQGRPNGQAGAPQQSTPGPVTAPPTPTGAGADVEFEAQNLVLLTLTEKGVAQKRSLPTLAFQKISDAAVRNAATRFLASDPWLASPDRPWQYNQGTGEIRPLA